MSVLNVNNLTKIFSLGFWPFKKNSTYTAVNNVSFQLKSGEILGLLGPNGAGKTTTIQMLMGTLTPSSGSINYFGKNFSQNRIESLQKIGYASGYDKLPPRLTVLENLDIVGRIFKIPQTLRMQRSTALLKTFQLWQLRNRQTGTLSAGQATRVILAKAFINNPDIVLLDEPTASLDPDIAYQIRQFILAQRKERNTAILFTSHNMDEVTELCDRILVLKNGTVIANNTPKELAQSTHLIRVNLTITHGLDEAISYLKKSMHIFSIEENNNLIVELNEQAIAPFLLQLSEHKIIYSQISIDKPTLEDYFINIARNTI